MEQRPAITILDFPDACLDIVQGQVGDRIFKVVPIHLGQLNCFAARGPGRWGTTMRETIIQERETGNKRTVAVLPCTPF